MKQTEPKARIVNVGYGIEVEIPNPPVEEQELGTHGVNDCGHHYNIFEEDDGFPQDRFYRNVNREIR